MRVFEIYRRLAGQVDATVVTGNYPGARNELIQGIRYARLGAKSPYAWSRWTYARAATQLLRNEAYDVGLVDFSVYTPIRLPDQRPIGLVVHMLHGLTATERWGAFGGYAIRETERRQLRSTHWISTTSEWMRRQLDQLVSPCTRIVSVGSGVDEEFRQVKRKEANYLLYYGRFDVFHKGIDTLLEAFARIIARNPDVELRIAGRGKDTARIVEIARELGLESRTRLMSRVERRDVLSLFEGALALMMPSRLEGLPMVPAEAMAAGVPVIATAVGAVPEVVCAPDGGILVQPDDPEALAEAALELITDPARRTALSQSARLSAQRFSWEAVAEQHLSFLNQVAAGANTGAQNPSATR